MVKIIFLKLSSLVFFSNVLMIMSVMRIDVVICVFIYDYSFDICRVILRFVYGFWMMFYSIVRFNVDI